MIFYFTGTGNSLYVSRRLAHLTGDSTVSIAEIMAGRPMPPTGAVSAIVYPVYAWSPPRMVLDFVRKHPIEARYFYSVCTCGENCGRAMARLEKAAARSLDAAWSIVCPNNFMVGYDVDTPQEAARKLAAADIRIAAIASALHGGERGIYDVAEGPVPGLLSAVVPLAFNAFARSGKRFYAEDSCTGCGQCAAVCPTRNISLGQRPRWGDCCTLCFGCINHCPARAIQWGNGTKDKGRYVNPNCRVSYRFD